MSYTLLKIPQTLGIRIATGTILGLSVLMFLTRLFSRSGHMKTVSLNGAESKVPEYPSTIYLQAKYSLGGCSLFSSFSQFLMSFLFYLPVFLATLALILSTYLNHKFVGDSKVFGFEARWILIGISGLGLLSLFLVPANASRIIPSVELAFLKDHVAEPMYNFLTENAGSSYTDLTFKFLGWYLYFLAYAFCLLCGLKVIDLEPEDQDQVVDVETPTEDSGYARKRTELTIPTGRGIRHLDTQDFGDTFFRGETSLTTSIEKNFDADDFSSFEQDFSKKDESPKPKESMSHDSKATPPRTFMLRTIDCNEPSPFPESGAATIGSETDVATEVLEL